MTIASLDNFIWAALTTQQSHFALGDKCARRYPAPIAPFVAVDAPTPQAEIDLVELVTEGEQVCLAGVAPPFSSAWKLEKQGEILQMIYPDKIVSDEDFSDIQLLTEQDIPARLELTALVYPAYFRAGAAGLGSFFGIYQDGRLAAMAGERMHLTGFQEISAVCTHPDFTGRRYAHRLVSYLVNKILERNETPFLHVDADNKRAIAVYERLGFKLRSVLPLWIIRRQPFLNNQT